jgi:hypothetical protein
MPNAAIAIFVLTIKVKRRKDAFINFLFPTFTTGEDIDIFLHLFIA